MPPVGALLGWKSTATEPPATPRFRLGPIAPTLVAIFLAFNTIFPLRHLLISGDPDFTEEGFRFSWRMMQRTQSTYHVKFRLHPPGLVNAAPEGGVVVDWTRWPGEPPPVVFVATGAQTVHWEKLPELVLVFEPCIGVRAIGNPHAASASPFDPEWSQRLIAQWHATTGRRATARPAQSLDAALASAQEQLSTAAGPTPAESWSVQLRRLRGARQVAKIEQPTPQHLVELIDVLYLLAREQGGQVVRRELALTSPFSVQGRRGDKAFVVLDDPALRDVDVWSGTVQLGKPGEPVPVLIDQARLRTRTWRSLPLTMLCEDPRGIYVNWNHHHELTNHQIRRMANTPGMIHNFAQHIAEEWRTKTGCRPEVFVDSLVSHNRRPLQPIVNPHVDLASQRLLAFGHNDWIAPLNERPEWERPAQGVQPASFSVATKAEEEVLERYPAGQRKITRRLASGGRTIISRWSQSDSLLLTAEYLHGQLDGVQTQYHPDGSRASLMHYRAGQPHGAALAWNADGRLATQAEYRGGQLVRSPTANDVIAEPIRIGERTELIRR
jgi:hypothetical protein